MRIVLDHLQAVLKDSLGDRRGLHDGVLEDHRFRRPVHVVVVDEQDTEMDTLERVRDVAGKLAAASGDGASRTRTGDLLGAITAKAVVMLCHASPFGSVAPFPSRGLRQWLPSFAIAT
jgi:hypothetical protein